MTVLAGPFAAICVLLALSGVFKLARPAPTAGALRTLRLPGSLPLVRLLGAGELGLGAAALLTGWAPLAALIGAAYAAFAGFVCAALTHGTLLQSCGCFGAVEVPPSRLHLAVNIAAAAVAGMAAVGRIDALPDVLADQPLAGVPFAVLTLVTVGLLYGVLTALPVALRATRP